MDRPARLVRRSVRDASDGSAGSIEVGPGFRGDQSMETRWARAAGEGVRPTSPVVVSLRGVPGRGCWGPPALPGPATRRPEDRRESTARSMPQVLAIDTGDRRGLGRRRASSRRNRHPMKSSCAGPISTCSGRIPNVQEARAFLQHQGNRQAGQAGRVPARSSRLRQEFRDPVVGPADRPGQPGADGRPRVADELAAQAIRVRSALERGRS